MVYDCEFGAHSRGPQDLLWTEAVVRTFDEGRGPAFVERETEEGPNTRGCSSDLAWCYVGFLVRVRVYQQGVSSLYTYTATYTCTYTHIIHGYIYMLLHSHGKLKESAVSPGRVSAGSWKGVYKGSSCSGSMWQSVKQQHQPPSASRPK